MNCYDCDGGADGICEECVIKGLDEFIMSDEIDDNYKIKKLNREEMLIIISEIIRHLPKKKRSL